VLELPCADYYKIKKRPVGALFSQADGLNDLIYIKIGCTNLMTQRNSVLQGCSKPIGEREK